MMSDVPVIIGDGVHDDLEGVQAAIDLRPFEVGGEPFNHGRHVNVFHYEEGGVKKHTLFLSPEHTYRVSAALVTPSHVRLVLSPRASLFDHSECCNKGEK